MLLDFSWNSTLDSAPAAAFPCHDFALSSFVHITPLVPLAVVVSGDKKVMGDMN